MWIPKSLAISALLLGCKDDPNAEVCHHYAKLFAGCHEDEKTAVVEETAYNFCIKGMNPKNDEIFGPKYRAKIECVRAVKKNDCTAYRACEDAP